MTLTIDLNSVKPIDFLIPQVETTLNWRDYLGTIKVRWGIGRDAYAVKPGLYKVGSPNRDSDVLVTANYKLSFDTLRKNLVGLDVWILVVDTKGVNVWCAAGKGNFSTKVVVNGLKEASLEHFVDHRRLILPQLSATGVAAYKVKEQSGFRVIFGPVLAKDIKPFIEAGYKATPAMREMKFPFTERAKLIPVDFMYGKYKLLLALITVFLLSGLDRTGLLFAKMVQTGWIPAIHIFSAYLAGIVLAPLMLPLVPFKPFALKGAFWGMVVTALLNLMLPLSTIELIGIGLINTSIASFTMMNFTGSSTYTSLSGVKKEMKWAIPFQIGFAAFGLILFIISQFI